MNTRQLRFPMPGTEPAVLTLPQALSAETLQRLETELSDTLGALRHELHDDTPDPGQIEYASWLPTRGAVPH